MRNSHATYHVYFFRRLIFMVAWAYDGNPSVLYHCSAMTSVTYQTRPKTQTTSKSKKFVKLK